MIHYRREIDGLRAIAVIPVVLFHAGFSILPGGFVGVDIFFVISGYLITSLILDDISKATFSFISFYERRARRILPALFLVTATSVPFAIVWMLPGEFKAFSASVVSLVLFSSNFLFYSQAGYFEQTAELKPLLHTWSLSVEEQFYVLFPLVIVAVHRYVPKLLVALLIFGLLASLLIAQTGGNFHFSPPYIDSLWSWQNPPPWGFFLLPTRAWELLVGSLIARGLYRHTQPDHGYCHLVNQLGSLLGLLLVAITILFYDRNTPFPGVYALTPTIGAALIIYFARQGTFVQAFLSHPALSSIGLISYSLYLWHQPLFAFARVRSLTEPSTNTFLSLIVLSIILAILTWRFVERPFRKRDQINRATIFKGAAFASIAIGSVGALGGSPLLAASFQRPDLQALESRVRSNFGLSKSCEYDENFFVKDACKTGPNPTLVVWGDSLAMHLVEAVKAANPTVEFAQATRSMCGPILDIAPTGGNYGEKWARNCIAFNNSVYSYIASNKHIEDVVMSSLFSQYVNAGQRLLVDGSIKDASVHLVVAELAQTVERLERLGKRVWIFSPPPASGYDIGRCLIKASLSGIPLTACDFPEHNARSTREAVWQFLRKAELSGIKINHLSDMLCREHACSASFGNVFMYRDPVHLSFEGSRFLGRNAQIFRLPKSSIARRTVDAD